ncbi:MAG: peptidoglycan editing factor PgeF [Clostridium sp.]|nr:peptidoglycan editing factor PgeF [Clostridium sp.]
MNYLNLNSFKKGNDFIKFQEGKIHILFSTAENNKNFNRNTEEGVNELEELTNKFDCKNIEYLKQTHSNKVYTYRKGKHDFKDNEGDAIITNEEKTIIGVFTADCVPVILVDKENNAIAAIHSGWKGTFSSIVREAILKMKEEYSTKAENLIVYIGPHIRKCCYEVSEELKEQFIERFNIQKDKLFYGRNLSLEECINNDLINSGILEENINSLGICTNCEKEIKLYSYRKSNGDYGRLFSFVYIKD